MKITKSHKETVLDLLEDVAEVIAYPPEAAGEDRAWVGGRDKPKVLEASYDEVMKVLRHIEKEWK